MTTSAEILASDHTIKTCSECGASFECPGLLDKFVQICPSCSKRKAAEQDRDLAIRAAAARARLWERLCPPRYRDTEAALLPQPDRLGAVLNWQHGSEGLLLHGPTGSGKTRCAWLLLKREFDLGRKIGHVESLDLSLRFAAMASQAPDAAAGWVDKLCAAEILFLDDPFKVKLTERVEETLFLIVARRTDHNRPLIVTTNDVGETLAQRMSEDRAAPLLRRLREFCTVISFSRQAEGIIQLDRGTY